MLSDNISLEISQPLCLNPLRIHMAQDVLTNDSPIQIFFYNKALCH